MDSKIGKLLLYCRRQLFLIWFEYASHVPLPYAIILQFGEFSRRLGFPARDWIVIDLAVVECVLALGAVVVFEPVLPLRIRLIYFPRALRRLDQKKLMHLSAAHPD